MNRRTFAAAGLAAAFALAAPSPTLAAPVMLEGAERTAAIARANASLNGVSNLQGRFVQIAPGGGRSTGAFYMQRPGKLRFEYDAPATLLIISDGRVVSMRDTALRTTDRTPLSSTPLNMILRQGINLERDVRITRVATENDALLIAARDRSGQADGEIIMYFYGPNAQMRAWDVIDATGARTRILLTNQTAPASLDRRLFRQQDIIENRPGARN